MMRRLALAALFAVCGGASAATLSDCDSPAFATVLQAMASPAEARAIWLDRRQARWPGVEAGGTFRLVGSTESLTLDAVANAGGVLLTVRDADLARLPALHLQALMLDHDGVSTRIQSAAALDDLYAQAANADDLGVTVSKSGNAFAVWAPTAQQMAVCIYDDRKAIGLVPMRRDDATGVWRTTSANGKYYTYLADVIVPGVGLVRNRVTDPYSISLTTDSRRSYIGSLDALKPDGWDSTPAPKTVEASTDMVVYELHVRDFSINDPTVSPAHRGKFAAFSESTSNGMRHLAALRRAGLTDIHLLPIFDFASVPEQGCAGGADTDCFNWGYDPYHYSAPEGSYATDPADGARRVIELRQMVMNLHRMGLRVGMDVVYNHTFAAGQKEQSVLDRLVPGYYHRLNAAGAIEQSTCCDNTATEHLMMGKLMIDSVALWTKHYKIDSFRFDLMGHQPRAVMEALQKRVDAEAGHPVQLIGEGWNFGEVANGARFVQASQLSLNGSGIGTFSDRARDAVRGGSASDAGTDLVARKGYINGNPQAADMVRVGLAGSIRSFALHGVTLEHMDYNGQPAGYASEPGEAVNYVENHDNQTLFDINVFKLPPDTSSAERARVQMLAAAINAFSQGVAYFHAGMDILRSKSLDRNSFNSGDWFNRIDWSYRDNYFGSGVPPAADNGKDYALIKPLLANPAIKPSAADIAYARDTFRDLLAIRASSTLFRMRSAADIRQRLHFDDSGTLIAARLDGKGYPGARYAVIRYFINVETTARTLVAEKGHRYRLHPAQRSDARVRQARYERASGTFTIPPRSAVVFVE